MLDALLGMMGGGGGFGVGGGLAAAGALVVAAACAGAGAGVEVVGEPRAEQRPVSTVLFGDERVDEYGWLRDRDDPGVIAHLHAENAYRESVLSHTAALQERIYEEMLSRIKETDLSVPMRDGEWLYYTRTEEGKDYAVYCRRPADGGAEEVYLDVNAMAEGKAYYDITGASVSPDHRYVAYLEDTDGDDLSDLRIKDLETGAMLGDVIEDVGSFQVGWDGLSGSVLYVRTDETRRGYQVWRHTLGTSGDDDELLFQEDDERFRVGFGLTRSDEWVMIESASSTTGELWAMDAKRAGAMPGLVYGRRDGVRLDGYAHMRGEGAGDAGWLYLINDDGAPNGQLLRRAMDADADGAWEVVEAHDPGVQLRGVAITAEHITINERRDGFRNVRVMRHDGSDAHSIAFDEAVGVVWATPGPMYETETLRVSYSSPLTPSSTYDYDIDGRSLALLKREEVPGGFDFDRYVVERIDAVAPDGVRVPMTVLRSRGMVMDGTTPALLYAYGSYGASMEPGFRVFRGMGSLLERGFVVAIAHVRGGGEMGRHWQEDGKFLKKMNTFTDFIACAEALFARGYTSSERLVIRGGSAGGLLVGAVMNLRPDLSAVAVADVPFVDSLNTMLDASLPLTTGEYEEWGNPTEEVYYRYMRSYAPYEQVGPRDYPDLLATGGMNDPRVPYWEPTKWVSRVRDRRTDDGLTLLRMQMEAGHGGASGRYERMREEAEVQAFILDRLGIGE